MVIRVTVRIRSDVSEFEGEVQIMAPKIGGYTLRSDCPVVECRRVVIPGNQPRLLTSPKQLFESKKLFIDHMLDLPITPKAISYTWQAPLSPLPPVATTHPTANCVFLYSSIPIDLQSMPPSAVPYIRPRSCDP